MKRWYIDFSKTPTLVGPCTYNEAYDESVIHFPHLLWVPDATTEDGVRWTPNDLLPLIPIIAWTEERYGEPALWSHLTEPDDDDPRPYVVDIERDWTYFDREFMFRDANAAMEFKMRWL